MANTQICDECDEIWKVQPESDDICPECGSDEITEIVDKKDKR